MKTKFSVILKVKKDILNKIERELIHINNAIASKEKEIATLQAQLRELKMPQVSVYRELMAFKDSIMAFQMEIEQEKNILEFMKSSKIDINKRYKIAMIEYEKINYLHLQIIEERLIKQHKEEQKSLDEFGGILHHRHSIENR